MAATMGDAFAQGSLPPHKPFVLQMSGAPGSGKSTTANLLAPLINGEVIDHDIIKSALLDSGIPFDQAAKAAYNVDWALAEAAIKRERTVIMDSTCNFDAILDRGVELARRYGCDYFYIECQVEDIKVLDERLRNRVPLRSQRTCVDCPSRDGDDAHRTEDTDALFEKWMKHPCLPKSNCIVVDSTVSLEKRSGFILERISRLTDAQASDVASPEPSSLKFLKGGLAV